LPIAEPLFQDRIAAELIPPDFFGNVAEKNRVVKIEIPSHVTPSWIHRFREGLLPASRRPADSELAIRRGFCRRVR
jgi:hypothetical protein